jgi:hypothetical protein
MTETWSIRWRDELRELSEDEHDQNSWIWYPLPISVSVSKVIVLCSAACLRFFFLSLPYYGPPLIHVLISLSCFILILLCFRLPPCVVSVYLYFSLFLLFYLSLFQITSLCCVGVFEFLLSLAVLQCHVSRMSSSMILHKSDSARTDLHVLVDVSIPLIIRGKIQCSSRHG